MARKQHRAGLTAMLTQAIFGSSAPGLTSLFSAALLFVGEQYQLLWPEKGVFRQKYLNAQAVRQAMLQEEITLCLPPGIRYYGSSPGGEWFLQLRPAGRVSLWLQEDGQPGGQLIHVALPTLLFYGCRNMYACWAIKDEELTEETRLYQAPLPNVAPDGVICFGFQQPPIASLSMVERAWEVFITSPFNTHHGEDKSVRFPKNVQHHLASLARRRRRRYPLEDLQPLKGGGFTLRDLLKSLAEHRKRTA